jgi:high-affinity iron transporter
VGASPRCPPGSTPVGAGCFPRVTPAAAALLAVAAVILSSAWPRAALAAPQAAAPTSPGDIVVVPGEARRALHLLSYVEGDYGGAVREGQVADPAELAEQLALLAQAESAIAAGLGPPAVDHFLMETRAARAAAEAHAPAPDVSGRLGRLAAALAALPGVLQLPSRPPSRARGEQIYREHCARCHGDDGAARTAAAAQLRPPPADLLDPRVSEWLSPARVALTVEFGITGTGMVPFGNIQGDERWDLAFFVASLDHGSSPPPSAPPPALSIAELALGSDHALREELLRGGVSVDDADPALAVLRTAAPFALPHPASPLSAARVSLRSARALAAAGVTVAASDATSEACRALATGLSLLPSGSAGDAARLEADRATLSALLARRAPLDALAAPLSSALDHALEAEVSLARPGRRPGARWLIAGAIVAGGVLAAALLLRARRRPPRQ